MRTGTKKLYAAGLVLAGLCAVEAMADVISIEGESAADAVVAKEARASGGLVAAEQERGSELVFGDVKVEKGGRYTLRLETFGKQVRGVALSVNGGKFVSRQISPGYDGTCGVGVWDVKLKDGANEILIADSGGPMPAIDRFTLEPAIDVTDAPGRYAIPFDAAWSFRWGKDKAAKEGWRTIDLPHDAQFEQPWAGKGSSGARGYKPMGEMWYRKTFRVEDWGVPLAGRRVFVEFGGALCVADVFVNGAKVAETNYGYLPVVGEITGALRPGRDNVIEVWCSTGRKEGSRWYTGAGLYRDAKIVIAPQVAISRGGVFVKSKVHGASANVNVSVELDGFQGMGNKAHLDVEVAVKDAEGNEVAKATARAPWSKNARQEVALPEMTIGAVKLWDISSPNLYTAETRLVYNGVEIDRRDVRFGVRTIEQDYAYGFKLNGRKVFLKSISCHHDLGLVGAAAYRRAIRRQFEVMKEFGFNAIRCSHNPYSEDFYELADEMGLLVVDELIDKWSDKGYWFGRHPFTTIWPQLVTEWMRRDRNHPSIIAWSFGNELQMRDDLCGYSGLNDWGVTMYRVIRAFSQRWDDTRPTTVAMFPSREGAVYKNDPGFMDNPRAPELALATDFAALNYQYQVYDSYVKNAPGLNIFQSEAVMKDLQMPYLGMDREHSIGCSWWGAIEYWGESNGWPKKGWNYSIFSHTLEPKPAAWLIKSVISDEPVVRIAVETGKGESEDWNDVKVGMVAEASEWEGCAGERKSVRVYTNQPEVELFLNGRSLGVKKNDATDIAQVNIVTWQVPFEPGELKAVAGENAHAVRTAGDAVAIKAEVESCDYKADGHDLIYVRCRAVDASGTQVRSWQKRVEFSCSGAAKFLACDNGDHYTDELFTRDVTAKDAKDGFILAVFRCSTEPGEVTITVTPEGLPPVVVKVQARL